MQVREAEYRPELSSIELISELRDLLSTERHAERLICRYLADLADRIRARSDMLLDAYVDEFHATRCFFQLGVRDTRERVRIGRALRLLPRVHHLIPQASGGAHSRANCIVLCTTHHRLLHEGKLRIIGDTERRLDVCDESGAPIEEHKPFADFALGSHAHSTEPRDNRKSLDSAVATSVTMSQGGSPAGLQVMAHRGGWTVDGLVDASGLSASTVLSTLLFLELDGSVRHRDSLFEPR